MNLLKWWRGWWAKRRTAKARAKAAGGPLREFVYLDEVSLRSLLSSQTGEMTDSTSEQKADALLTELGGKAAADGGVVKSELTSRFQTTNSSTLQTSRKATVQSWFREFHGIKGLRLIEPQTKVEKVSDARALLGGITSIAVPASVLPRGELVEFRVTLSADPVFHLGTMVSEFSEMAADSPDVFAASNVDATLKEVQPINRILHRLLAGLIPVRGLAADYVVVTVDGEEIVAHREAIEGLDLPSRPLEIVGVTEHLAYWKDIRRVLFSNAVFTVLCRISRPGLHASWTPVKLADLFRHLTPDLVDQINVAGRLPFMSVPTAPAEDPGAARMAETLRIYAENFLKEAGKELTEDQEAALAGCIQQAQSRFGSATGQRSAFRLIGQWLSQTTGAVVDHKRDHQLRETARDTTGLPLFPSLAKGENSVQAVAVEAPIDGARILDVEVIAIYW